MSSVIIQDCLICRQASRGLICDWCRHDLAVFVPPLGDKNLMLWPKVSKGLHKVSFSRLYALADYQWPLSTLLTGLKFSAKLPHAKALAELFVEHNLGADFNLPQLLVPMPLHSNRFLWRKYNQSYEICRHLSAISGIPCNHSMLRRSKATSAQTQLSAAKRQANLRHAFSLAPDSIAQLEHYQHIALVDDVITTGATANAAYLCLTSRFPQLRIDIWSICVTIKT